MSVSFATVTRLLRKHLALTIATAAALAAIASGTLGASDIRGIVDWRLLLVLFAMLVAVESLRVSNLLDHVVRDVASRFRSKRSFTLALIALAGALAAVATNDVALFVVIPFTLAATRLSDFDAANAVMLQIIATNLIGCISPLGNPQNLYVYHRWKIAPETFISAMLPFVVVAGIALLLAALVLEPKGSLRVTAIELPRVDALHALAGATAFALVLLNVFRVLPVWPAAAIAFLTLPLVITHEESRVDLSIVPLFFCAFIAVEGLRRGGLYGLLSGRGEMSDLRLYFSALSGSQVISNVPATILLAPSTGTRWRLLLYGVNAAGCGTIIASLANLLGWQIYRRHGGDDPHFFRRFTVLNVMFLGVAATTGWILWRAGL